MTKTGNAIVFKVLGPWEVLRGGVPVSLPHGRPSALLAALLLSIDQPVSVDALAERLWVDRMPVRPREVIHTYVNRLRKSLGPDLIATGSGGYRLRADPDDIDLYQFRGLVATARNAGTDAQERELLHGALRLWRGKPFGGVPSPWLDREVVPRLTEEWLDTIERRIDLDLATDPPSTVTAELWRLTDEHPLRESLWIRLISALHAAGRRTDALDAYLKAYAVFEAELGLEPGEQLAQLRRMLLPDNVDAEGGTQQPGAAALPRPPAGRKPRPPELGCQRAHVNVEAMGFGESLRAYRTRLGLTQATLAEQAGVSERTVHGLESGRSRPRQATAWQLATALRLKDPEREAFLLAASGGGPDTPAAGLSEPAGPPTPAQLPPDVQDFTGRTVELAELDALLPVTGGTVVVLSGTAGVGKTALAVHWAHQVAAGFPDGQLYANLRGFAPGQPVPPVEVLAGFLGALGVGTAHIPPQQDAAAALYRSLLAGRRMLVVLDNALDADQVRPLLPSGGSLVVVTSRRALSGLVVSHSAHQRKLAPLPPDEATELMTQVLGAERMSAEPEAVAALVEECSGLPLALRIAAANVRTDQHLGIGGYVAELRSGDRLASLDVSGDPAASVRAAFDWSYERLPSPVQGLFRQLGLLPGPDVSAEAAAALLATDPRQVHGWLRSLADAHLLDRSASQRYTLHDLLHAYAAEQSQTVDPADEREAAIDRLLAWYLHSTVAAAEVLSPTTLRLPTPPPDPALPIARPWNVDEARGWLAAELRGLVAAVTYATASGRHETAWLIADAMRGFFETTGNRVDWNTVTQAAWAAATAAGDLAACSAAASSLAHIHHAGGEREDAFEQATKALTTARQAEWLAGEARALNHLAVLHVESGELDKSVELFEAALRIDRRTGDRFGEAKRLMNLGVITQSTGRLHESLEYMRQAVDLLGTQTQSHLMLANYGHTQHYTGALDAADVTLRQAVAAHSGNPVGRAYSLAALAELCLDRGQQSEAKSHIDTAQSIVESTGDRENGFWVTNEWAIVYLRLGQPERVVERLLRLLREAGGEGYLQARCTSLANLATARRVLGQLDLALRHADQSLELAVGAGRRLLENEARFVRAEVQLARYRRDGSATALAEAAADAKQVLEAQRWTGHRVGEARTLLLLGDISHESGEPEAAVWHWRAAQALCTELGLAGDGQEAAGRLARAVT